MRKLRETIWHEELFRAIAENVFDGLIVIENERITYASPAYCRMLGYAQEAEIGRTREEILALVHPEDVGQVVAIIDGAIREKKPSAIYGYRCRKTDGSYFWREDRAAFLYSKGGNGLTAYVVARDVTERKQVESALQASEARLRLALEVAQMGHWRYDCVTGAVDWFSGHQELFGISLEAFGGDLEAVQEMVHPDDRAHGIENMRKVIAGEGPFDNTYRVVHPDQSVHWLHSYGHLFRDGEGRPSYILGITQDITERKNSKIELERQRTKLRELAKELTQSEERQRRQLALRLHDGVGQLLTVAIMKLNAAESQAGRQEPDWTKIRLIVERALEDTRTLTGELSPPLLYEVGLVPALGWLLERFQGLHPGLRFELTQGAEPVGLEYRILFFQIARELLFNVVKHARAQNVWMRLESTAARFQMRIRDDGVGGVLAEAPYVISKGNGFGLFSIRERIQLVGGELAIVSRRGKGTTVTVSSPYRRSEERP